MATRRDETSADARDPQHDRLAAEQRPIETGAGPGGHADDSLLPAHHDALGGVRQELDSEELARLTVLQPGTRLEQGGTYLDLNDRERGPFRALGGQEAGPKHRYVAKRQTDRELWNRLAGGRDTEIERPTEA